MRGVDVRASEVEFWGGWQVAGGHAAAIKDRGRAYPFSSFNFVVVTPPPPPRQRILQIPIEMAGV